VTGFQPDLKNVSLDDWDNPVFQENDLKVSVLRLDKIHPLISGNKWFKLKYYLEEARKSNKNTLASFGGAYSNHLLAVSAAAHVNGFSSLGFVRGEEPATLSFTLQAAKEQGMELRFLSRRDYELKKKSISGIWYEGETGNTLTASPDSENKMILNGSIGIYDKTEHHNSGIFLIPEGGGGKEGVRGAEEILSVVPIQNYSHICCAVGTGTTLAGIVNSAASHCKIVGVSVLKGTRLFEPMNLSWIKNKTDLENVQMIHSEHFGGYAKYTAPLLDFMNRIFAESGIPTDFVYTAKLFYAIDRMVAMKSFPAQSRILIIHTGGLQGNHSLAPGRLQF